MRDTARRIALRATAIAIAASLMIGVLGAAAEAAPAYGVNPFSCYVDGGNGQGHVVNAGLPYMAASSQKYAYPGLGENVTWQPALYRWNGKAWQSYQTGWAQGVAYTNHPNAGWANKGGMQIIFYQFFALPAGYYAVYNYLTWSNGQTAGAWSQYGNTGYSYCYFT